MPVHPCGVDVQSVPSSKFSFRYLFLIEFTC